MGHPSIQREQTLTGTAGWGTQAFRDKKVVEAEKMGQTYHEPEAHRTVRVWAGSRRAQRAALGSPCFGAESRPGTTLSGIELGSRPGTVVVQMQQDIIGRPGLDQLLPYMDSIPRIERRDEGHHRAARKRSTI